MSYIFSLTCAYPSFKRTAVAIDRAINGDIRGHMSIIEKNTEHCYLFELGYTRQHGA